MHYATDGGITLNALGPEEPLVADGANDVNENSVVLRLMYRSGACARLFRMLFMGSVSAEPGGPARATNESRVRPLVPKIFYAADAMPTRTRAPKKAPTLTPTCAVVALLSEFDFNRRYANQANSRTYQ